MPLSEHEQRLLEQMERALYAEDPKFATTLRSGGNGRTSRGRAALGVVAFLAGVGLLMAGVMTSIIAIGIVGFVAMLVGAVVTYAALRPRRRAEGETPTAAPGTGGAPASKPQKSAGMMNRLEDRWRKRRETGGM